jgi:hypothetical protein
LIENHERDFDFLSGRSDSNSPSPARASRSPDGKSVSGFSDHSKITRFLRPVEHLETLHRQKSPLRRSNSAQFLRTLIQGKAPSPDFYKAPKQRECRITDNLIKFNQSLLVRDQLKQTKRKQGIELKEGIIGA